MGAFGVDQHDPAGVLGPERRHVLGPEPLVDRAVAFPQQEGGRLHLGVVQAPEGEAGVPERHVTGAVAELEAGVAAEVLVGEEEDLVADGLAGPIGVERPGQDGPGVGRGADGAAVGADERLQGGRGVHVGDGDDPLDVGDLGQGVPGLLDGVDVGHVGHRAAGVQVRQEHLLVVGGQHIGRLGHEVHPAEDDELGFGAFGGHLGQAERVASGVGPGHDLVALVVVAEDEQPVAERRLGGADPRAQFVRRRVRISLWESALESDHDLPPRWGSSDVAGGDSTGRPSAGLSASELVCSRDTGPACHPV